MEVGEYQLQAQAPATFSAGNIHRAIDGKLVKGSWSDPWWGYAPGRGWALIRRWKNRAKDALVFNGKTISEAIPARDEVVVAGYSVTR